MQLKKTLAPALLIILIIMSIAGCSNKKEKAAAKVDGTVITVAELETAIDGYRQQFASQGQSIPESELALFRGQVLESLIRKTALLNAANEANITADQAEVDGEIESIRAQFADDDQYREALKSQGFTEESLRKQIGDDMAIADLIDVKVLQTIDIPEDEVTSFFNENPDYFIVPETVTASHILIEVAENASDEDVATARGKIDTILEELKAGADFAKMAKERSEGPSGPSGGDLGEFGRGQMVTPFEDAAFALGAGELSDVVRTQFGFHIILVRDHQDGREKTYDEVKEEIVEYLRQVEGEGYVSAFIEDLVNSATIERLLDS